MEIWRDIDGYEGLYQVSNLGRVKSFKHKTPQILKSQYDKNYLSVALCRGGKMKYALVHRLVAQAFIPNPDGKPQVNHVNGNKTDNRVENLEWATASENNRHAYMTGLRKSGEDNSLAKLTNEQAEFIRDNPGNFSQRELAKMFGVNWATICQIQRGICYRNAGGQIRDKINRRIPDEVRNEIRRLYVRDSHEFGLQALAKKYGVSQTTILNIVHGR